MRIEYFVDFILYAVHNIAPQDGDTTTYHMIIDCVTSAHAMYSSLKKTERLSLISTL